MIIKNKAIKSVLDFSGKYLHAPEQRIILGATALATQPLIDLKNKNVDEETRKTSVARTIAKIIAGTLVGVAVRYAGIAFVRRYTKYTPVINAQGLVEKLIPQKGRSFFVPLFTKKLKPGQESIFPISKKALDKRIEKYIKAMGTLAATIAMIGTNFLCDAPLTKWMTNIFVKKIEKDKTIKESEGR